MKEDSEDKKAKKLESCLLHVMSYNILYHHETSRGDDYRWQPRAEDVCSIVLGHAPDLAGFQEVTEAQFGDLKAALTGYAARESPPTVEGVQEGGLYPWFFNAVFYLEAALLQTMYR